MKTYDGDATTPGLAAERTDLAWSRSGLSIVACGAAILHGVGRPPFPATHRAVGVVVLLLGGIAGFLGAWYGQRRARRGVRPARGADLATVALGVAAVGIAAFLVSV